MSEEMVLDITSLAAGGDGVARDSSGRVVFVPHTAPGAIACGSRSATTNGVVRPRRGRRARRGVAVAAVVPPCKALRRGLWRLPVAAVDRAGQLVAKQAIVAGALRKLAGLVIEPIADPVAPYGWRRRARFHVAGGVLDLYAPGSRTLVRLTELRPARGCS